MRLLLDAGAFVAVERGDKLVQMLLKQQLQAEQLPITHAGVIGQVWRGGARQARLSAILPGCRVLALDESLARRAGVLLGHARMTDIVDAALVMLATDGDTIVTSDRHDLEALAEAAGVHVDLFEV